MTTMKVKYLVCLLLLINVSLFAQKNKSGKGSGKTPAEPEIYTKVDEAAEFTGGSEAMIKFINDNLTTPASAKEKGLAGKCMLKLTVSDAGKVVDAEVTKGVPSCKECDAEAIRIAKMMPDWKPAMVKKKAVKSYTTITIEFKKVEKDQEESSSKKKKHLD
jgi:TonB family protein